MLWKAQKVIVGTVIEHEMPKKPFLYIGARSLTSSALTSEAGKIIESKKGRFLKLKLFERHHSIDQKGFSFDTVLRDYEKVAYSDKVDRFDFFYRLSFDIKSGGEMIKSICRGYADYELDHEEAWRLGASHWGSQRWSGLMAVIIDEGFGVPELIHGTEVDIFAPYCEKVSEDLIVYGLYSHRKTF